jgi:hypothetical protein
MKGVDSDEAMAGRAESERTRVCSRNERQVSKEAKTTTVLGLAADKKDTQKFAVPSPPLRTADSRPRDGESSDGVSVEGPLQAVF